MHIGDGRRLEPLEHIVGHLSRHQVFRVLRKHSGDIERHVAVADDRDLFGLERPFTRHIGVPVVPGDEVCGTVGAIEVDALDLEWRVLRSACREDHCVVVALEVVECDVGAEVDVAKQPDDAGFEHLAQGVDDRLDTRMVGCDTVSHESVGGRQGLKQVDADFAVARCLLEDVSCVDASRASPDDCNANRCHS